MISKKKFIDVKILALPCHMQSVERHIKLVTEAASSVCYNENREGYIFNTLKSRATMPHFNPKSHWNSLQ